MGALENAYLCPKCDHVAPIPHNTDIENLLCDLCSFDEVGYAIHINAGTRKRWIEIEKSSPWRWNKKIMKSMKNDMCDDDLWKGRLENITKQIFTTFNDSKPEEIFPHYRVDFARTAKITVKIERGMNIKATKRGLVRGELYEGMFLRTIDGVPNIYRNFELIETNRGERCRPDAWVSFGKNRRYPVEFKTLGKGDFVIKKMKKMLIQSRKQGRLSDFTHNKNRTKKSFGVSMLIVCCPEDRSYCSFLIDRKIEGLITHLQGRKSVKRISREENRKLQEKSDHDWLDDVEKNP